MTRLAEYDGGLISAAMAGCRRILSTQRRRVGPMLPTGIANSRAEVLRWAVGRIRENPAYAQLQERVHEIDELKAQF